MSLHSQTSLFLQIKPVYFKLTKGARYSSVISLLFVCGLFFFVVVVWGVFLFFLRGGWVIFFSVKSRNYVLNKLPLDRGFKKAVLLFF